jgi:SAM-dependent methyltransferase
LAQQINVGDAWLELACGTGVDAVWLAAQGVSVTCGDGSADMLRQTRQRSILYGVQQQIDTVQFDLAHPPHFAKSFDGVLSNFGGLNSVANLQPLAEMLAGSVRPNGTLVLVPMGKHCPWEVAWYAGHADFGRAFRRYNQPALATIGNAQIPIWYPDLQQLIELFAPTFTLTHAESLGLFLPPSYLEKAVRRFSTLAKLDAAFAQLFPHVGDHLILVLRRNRP